LKEGLTVFRDQEFSSDLNNRGVKRIGDVMRLRAAQFAEDSSPMAHPVRPESYIKMDNFYTVTVYEKGAEVVRMYQVLPVMYPSLRPDSYIPVSPRAIFGVSVIGTWAAPKLSRRGGAALSQGSHGEEHECAGNPGVVAAPE